jgi:osmotically-inducible protein OsmY
MKHPTLAKQPTVAPTRIGGDRPAVVLAMTALAGIPIERLQVDMFGDALYINGLAAGYETKQEAARRLAEALPGICVINELRVAHSGVSDTDTARAVTLAIGRIAAGSRITVDVEDGEVHLRGIARDQAEAAAIEAAAWATLGVRHVHHRMSCQQAIEPRQIEHALGEYIARSAGVPAESVAVRYDRGIVELRGSVATAQQREAIEDLVRWHESVIDVINRIRVAPSVGAS